LTFKGEGIHYKFRMMKKLMFVLVAGFLIALASSSCKSHETCPAYGAAEIQVEQSNS